MSKHAALVEKVMEYSVIEPWKIDKVRATLTDLSDSRLKQILTGFRAVEKKGRLLRQMRDEAS